VLDPLTCLVYGVPAALLCVGFLRRRSRLEALSAEAHKIAQSTGLKEPPSLHPVVDPARCIGCGTCVKVCPEQPEHHVLGIIGGRAELVSPADCIGHGACRAACPVEAITLVFGTERRGVEIPLLSPRFETSVPGIFVAGELGGMGLIRNALEQGRQAVEAIHESRGRDAGMLDLIIVGAGPAGFAASLTAMSKRMRFLTLEQESLGGCVFQYPRGKLVMTAPATVPLIGRVDFKQTSKEALLEFWREVERKTGLEIRYGERVDDVVPAGQGFIVKTPRGEYATRSVLLAIGRRGTPRKLQVPGEALPKVVYRLIDPEQYAGRHVLVVGGGDSALEAAASLTESGSSSVALSYRGEGFDRAKPANRQRVQAAEQAGGLRVLLRSNVQRIETGSVVVEQNGQPFELHNDAVIVNAGGVLPSDFLRRIGINVETKYGTA
jgi:thioredoxin reductase (NADPH)